MRHEAAQDLSINVIDKKLIVFMTHRRKILYLSIIAILITGMVFFHYVVSPVNDLTGTKIIDIPKDSAFFSQTTEILDELVLGQIKVYPVTLPEDITVRDVARRLSAFKLVNEKEFMTLAFDRSFIASLDIEADSIEGYLYPDTYRFDRSMTTREIIRILVGKFWKEITPEMRKRAKEIGLTQTQWVTLASIIGKYSGNTKEKAIISAVFHNRLKKGMKLQSDPTAIYGLELKEKLSGKDRKYYRKSDTPYNTYRIKGLPPGPIANPSIDSLRAALYPAKIDYLYIIAKKDGTYKFSKKIETRDDFQVNGNKM